MLVLEIKVKDDFIGSERECSLLETLEMSLNFGIREKTVDGERLIRRLVQILGIR